MPLFVQFPYLGVKDVEIFMMSLIPKYSLSHALASDFFQCILI